jgi:hypothetical protein
VLRQIYVSLFDYSLLVQTHNNHVNDFSDSCCYRMTSMDELRLELGLFRIGHETMEGVSRSTIIWNRL